MSAQHHQHHPNVQHQQHQHSSHVHQQRSYAPPANYQHPHQQHQQHQQQQQQQHQQHHQQHQQQHHHPHHHQTPQQHNTPFYAGHPAQQQQQQHHQRHANHAPNVAASSQSAPGSVAATAAYMMNCYQTNANGWAGVPLISTASRRPRKNQAPGSVAPQAPQTFQHGQGGPLRVHNHQQQQHQHQQQHNSQHQQQHPLLAAATEFDENAMSRLAAHAHGAPLILTGRHRHKSTGAGQSATGSKHTQHNQHHAVHRTTSAYYVPPNSHHNDDLLGFGGAPSAGHHAYGSSGLMRPSEANAASVVAGQQLDNASVHSDEGCTTGSGSGANGGSGGLADMCLPRIIKPRKRRKKDRKPSAQAVGGMAENGDILCENQLNGGQASANGHNYNAPHANYAPNLPLGESLTFRDFGGEQQRHNFHGQFCGPYVASSGPNYQPDMHNTTFVGALPSGPNQLPSFLGENPSNNTATATDPLLPTSGEPTSSCSCRLCDPSGRIWAFPLRRSCSDQSDTVEAARRKSIGVIGGNRRQAAQRTEWRSSGQLRLNIEATPSACTELDSATSSAGLSRKGSFSDSDDSGCDILSALSFCDELLLGTAAVSPGAVGQQPADQFRFPEVVFSESINEITRKMLDVLDVSSDVSGSSGSEDDGLGGNGGTGGGLFGDDFLLNLDAANASGLLDGVAYGLTGNCSADWRSSFDLGAFLQHGVGAATQRVDREQRDRGDDVHNCFDQVWTATRQQRDVSVRE